jgi:hypothetical protein
MINPMGKKKKFGRKVTIGGITTDGDDQHKQNQPSSTYFIIVPHVPHVHAKDSNTHPPDNDLGALTKWLAMLV